MPSLWSLAIPILLSVLSTIVETVEDVYLFWESHYERTRDFEKIDDLFDVRHVPRQIIDLIANNRL